ncbi:unnamed protein product [Fusarium venenatum]|uniref:Transcription factor domain-containing protein n=1 Tax=Fusarium venenatum TaxID=56646 RepID=A0A2L2SV50_9HYPO|nr:uncharacterized protein FVRRES_04605 [Fusarium venenatum]KAH6991761.1 hypothetical protein EDB82DRAFT_121315 [Fusarium venenatum]CEI60169.1 unnamed protein product [Fusarium venenatum]
MQKVMISRTATQLPPTLQLGSDVLSRHTFLSLYVDGYSYGFHTLASLLAGSSPRGLLQATVDAVSLAFMSFRLNRQDIVPLANKRYLVAIRSLRIAMQSSQKSSITGVSESVNDETLQSVLLLDLYEKMAYHHYQLSEFPDSWLSHVQGALSMVQSRPRTDYSNPTTQQLATRTVIALTLSCGAAGVSIPQTLHSLHHDLDGYVQNAKWTFIGLLMSLVNFRADMRSGKIKSPDILTRARELDIQFSHAEGKIPSSWWPRRVSDFNTQSFGYYYDVYPCHYTTQVFNAYRIMRLELNDVMRKIHPCTSVSETIVEVTEAICATVPQFILPGVRPDNNLPFTPKQILECSGILTPLYVAAQVSDNSAMREWILRLFIYMADQGARLAGSVAHILTSEPGVDYWAVFKMAGSCAVTA